MIERQIIAGLIISTEYCQAIRRFWDNEFLELRAAQLIAEWCWQYFEKYNRAPGKDIEGIYYQNAESSTISSDVLEDIENILDSLNQEYSREKFNLQYWLDFTFKHFRERKLLTHSEKIKALLDNGELEQAEEQAIGFNMLSTTSETDLIFGSDVLLDRIERAFNTTSQPVLRYPFQLGEFINDQLVRGAFVVFMGPEKRGKTFWLLDMAIRGCRQGARVAFFQAGDMTEAQLLKRVCVYLTKTSDLPKYVGKQWEPVRDCKLNQIGKCRKKERENNINVFEDYTNDELDELSIDDLIEAYNKNPNYRPCCYCKDYWRRENGLGIPWVVPVQVEDVLHMEEAKKIAHSFFVEKKRNFRLSTHANNTLTVSKIRSILSVWEKTDGFIPDMVVVDYADLLVPERRMEFRHEQNEIWKNLRGLSEEKYCLLITATQTDAASYEQNKLRLKNFTEDKRKYGHVTAMYGLNQDKDSREKRLGILRLNEIVIREGDFAVGNEVVILQNLKRGRPFIGSFFK